MRKERKEETDESGDASSSASQVAGGNKGITNGQEETITRETLTLLAPSLK